MVVERRPRNDTAETSAEAQARLLEEAEATRISAIVAEQVNRLTENHQAVLDPRRPRSRPWKPNWQHKPWTGSIWKTSLPA